jgi:ABC-2 type transport system ATP-binding protein
MIRMLTGQINLSSGHATVAGCDVMKDRQRSKERIGVVFEEQNLSERLSARDNLRFNCWLYGLPESRVENVLELVELAGRSKDPRSGSVQWHEAAIDDRPRLVAPAAGPVPQ